MNISYPDQLVCFALQVKLADRALLPGDVVKFSDVNQGTQKGFVSNVEVAASVKAENLLSTKERSIQNHQMS